MILITHNKRGIAAKSIQVKEGFVVIIRNDNSGRPYVQIGERGRFELDTDLAIMTDTGTVIQQHTVNQLVEDEYLRFDRNILLSTTLFGNAPKSVIRQADCSFCGLVLENELITQVFPSGLFGFENKIILADQATITDEFKVVHGPKELIGVPLRHVPNNKYYDYTIWALSSFSKLTREVLGGMAINFIDETVLLNQAEPNWRTLLWKDPKRVATAIANDVSKTTRSAFNEEVARIKLRE